MKKLIEKILNHFGYYKKLPAPVIIEKRFKPVTLRFQFVIDIENGSMHLSRREYFNAFREHSIQRFLNDVRPFVKVYFDERPHHSPYGGNLLELELNVYQDHGN